ncbi:hypothetical protein N0V88_002775 [Collariella sp. IMI 366227]|nr:hypothetical protein N0V88_002775 [Collariella sp. IMI 366227]
MEFRPVVQVCRSAAAATRPSLPRSAPSILFSRHRQFSTDSKRRLSAEAAAAASSQSQSPSSSPRSAQAAVDKLRSKIERPHLPPRPPVVRSNFFQDQAAKKTPPPSWTSPLRTANSPRSAMKFTGSASATSEFPSTLSGLISSDMQGATGTLGRWREGDFLKGYNMSPQSEIRLRPSTGRTVEVRGQVDLARGLRLLQRLVATNKIQRDLRVQRFHERPALKRKRMKRERWQVRFKDGFKATIARVMELKKQGW